jgi:hypothetical protein
MLLNLLFFILKCFIFYYFKKWENKHEYFVTSCGFSYDENSLVVSVSDVDFLVKIWDTKSGKLVRNIPGKK